MIRDSRVSDVRIRPREVSERDRAGFKSSPASRGPEDYERVKNRLITCEGELTVKTKEALQLKAEKKKMDEQIRELARLNDKYKEQLAKSGSKLSVSQVEKQRKDREHVHKMEVDHLTGEIKGLQNLIRNKDKEIERLSILVEEAIEVKMRNKELENQFSHMQQQLDSASQEIRTLQQVNRQRDQDIGRLTDEMDELRNDLLATTDSLYLSNSTLKAMEAKNMDMSTELCVMRDELTRTNVVAHRVAKGEHKAGLKGLEGTVSAQQHQEEMRYLQGEIGRLKDKLGLTERDLSVSRDLQEKYKKLAESRSNFITYTPTDVGSPMHRGSRSSTPTDHTAFTPAPRPSSAGYRTSTARSASPAYGSKSIRPPVAPRSEDSSDTSSSRDRPYRYTPLGRT